MSAIEFLDPSRLSIAQLGMLLGCLVLASGVTLIVVLVWHGRRTTRPIVITPLQPRSHRRGRRQPATGTVHLPRQASTQASAPVPMPVRETLVFRLDDEPRTEILSRVSDDPAATIVLPRRWPR